MNKQQNFEKELATLLSEYGYALVCESQNNEDDWSVQIGIQDEKGHCKWLGRHHVVGGDLDITQKKTLLNFI